MLPMYKNVLHVFEKSTMCMKMVYMYWKNLNTTGKETQKYEIQQQNRHNRLSKTNTEKNSKNRRKSSKIGSNQSIETS